MDLSDLQKKNRELSILNTIAQDLNRGWSLDDALNTTLKQIVQLFGLETGWIWLFESENETAHLKAAYQLPPAFLDNPQFLEGTCYCIEKYLRGSLANATNISEIACSRLKDLTKGTNGLLYHASIPLSSAGKKVGIINVLSSDSQELSDNDLQLLYTIGDMLSIAIERNRLFERSKQLGVIEERNRLAREIHDTLAQGLSAISLKLETLGLLYDQESPKEKIMKTLEQTQQLTRDNLEDARRSVLDLRASPLAENGLEEALKKILAATNISSSYKREGTPIPLSVRVEMGLYRIAQEAVLNASRHANAKQLELFLQFEPDKIILQIIDDGDGFIPEEQKNLGFGLRGLHERAKLLGGQCQIKTLIGTGTIVYITIPINQ